MKRMRCVNTVGIVITTCVDGALTVSLIIHLFSDSASDDHDCDSFIDRSSIKSSFIPYLGGGAPSITT